MEALWLCGGAQLRSARTLRIVRRIRNVRRYLPHPTKMAPRAYQLVFRRVHIRAHAPDYEPLHPQYGFSFTSYYVHAGERHCRAHRGYMSRPTLADVFDYRSHVDKAMLHVVSSTDTHVRNMIDPTGTDRFTSGVRPFSSGRGFETALLQMFGDVWEWTRSHNSPYPGYAPPAGAPGEYNGKFMCNQFVLRGRSCTTSETHIRRTYRNFFRTEATCQFSGFRLARISDAHR